MTNFFISYFSEHPWNITVPTPIIPEQFLISLYILDLKKPYPPFSSNIKRRLWLYIAALCSMIYITSKLLHPSCSIKINTLSFNFTLNGARWFFIYCVLFYNSFMFGFCSNVGSFIFTNIAVFGDIFHRKDSTASICVCFSYFQSRVAFHVTV